MIIDHLPLPVGKTNVFVLVRLPPQCLQSHSNLGSGMCCLFTMSVVFLSANFSCYFCLVLLIFTCLLVILLKHVHGLYCRLLESLQVVAESIPIPPNSTEPVVITQTTFAVSVQEVEPEFFAGFTFSASIDSGSDRVLSSDSLSFGEGSDNVMGTVTSMSLPANLFQSIPVTNTTRITQSVFVNDALFLRRNVTVGQREVGAIILAAEVVGSRVSGLDPPITLTFVKNQVYTHACASIKSHT